MMMRNTAKANRTPEMLALPRKQSIRKRKKKEQKAEKRKSEVAGIFRCASGG
jgi:hypothetical protein